MDKHAHATCEHELRWCRHCDTAYCTRCDIEWTRGVRWNLTPQWGTYNYNSNATANVPLPLTVPTAVPTDRPRFGEPEIRTGVQAICNHAE
jgi:hypothetical protein